MKDKIADDALVTVGLLRKLQEPTREFCYGKIHRCRVTESNVDYVGSITIDSTLLKAAGILPYSKVEVVNVTRKDAARIMTYAIEGPENSGIICLNGAAAHHFDRGDLAIIIAYETVPVSQIVGREHRVVQVDSETGILEGHTNRILDVKSYVTPSLDELGKPENAHYGKLYSAEIVKLRG